jgi:cytoskeletal protein CcmA (bactofilin family)
MDVSLLFADRVAMKKEKNMEAITTFIGTDTHIEGAIEFEKSLRIDGMVKGSILSAGGTVIVGEKAGVEADISVDTAIIMGVVTGKIEAARRIELHAPAKIKGNIASPCIAIDTGVRFDGHCLTKDPVEISSPSKESQKQPIIKENLEE